MLQQDNERLQKSHHDMNEKHQTLIQILQQSKLSSFLSLSMQTMQDINELRGENKHLKSKLNNNNNQSQVCKKNQEISNQKLNANAAPLEPTNSHSLSCLSPVSPQMTMSAHNYRPALSQLVLPSLAVHNDQNSHQITTIQTPAQQQLSVSSHLISVICKRPSQIFSNNSLVQRPNNFRETFVNESDKLITKSRKYAAKSME